METQPRPKPRRRWWQFSLRLVLIVVTLCAVPLAWIAMKLREAETQKKAVTAWTKLHVEVEYSNRSRVPQWLGQWALDLMGKDAYYLDSVSTRQRHDLYKRAKAQSNLNFLGDAIFLYDADGSGTLLDKAKADRAKQQAKHDAEVERLQPLQDEHFVMLSELVGIEALQLHGTEITDATLARLTHLTELESLHLPGTGVTDAGMKHIAQCGSLRNLGLEETKITDAGLAQLAKLADLESLDLGGTQVTSEGLRHARGMTELKFVGPPGPLSDAGLACLKNMTELTQLDVGNMVTDAGLRHLRKMTKLHTLTITAPITGEGLVHLQPLTSLRILYLERSDVNDETVAHLKNVPKLEWIDLSQTLVTDAGLEQLRDWRRLTRLFFTEPYVTQKAQAELQKALPKCVIGLAPWPGPPLRDVDYPHAFAAGRLVASRSYADGCRGFHLAGDGRALYLVHKPGPKDPHFTNLYLVPGLDDPPLTRLNRLLFGDQLCKDVSLNLEAALEQGGVVHFDKNARRVQATREEILKRHGKKRGEQLLQLRVVWEELWERYAE